MSPRDDDKYLFEYLTVAKNEIESGRKELILKVMHHCLLMNRPLPDWLRWAFIKAYQSAYPYKRKSWDDIFGKPHPKGVHLEAKQKHFELRFPIWLRVQELARSGKKIDKRLFEKVGKELGISGTTASEIYYEKESRQIFSVLTSARQSTPYSIEASKVAARRKSRRRVKPLTNSKKN
jgi:hypothetical protein